MYQNVPHRVVLYCTVRYGTAFTILYRILLYCTVLYCIVLYCTVLYCTVLYCAVWCDVQYRTLLFCTTLLTVLCLSDCNILNYVLLT